MKTKHILIGYSVALLVLLYLSIPGIQAITGTRESPKDVTPVVYPRLPVAPDRVFEPKEAIRRKIVRAAEAAGINPATAVRIANCESGLKPWVKNAHSSASGLYQFTKPTWEYIGAPGSPFDEDEAIRQFVKHYPKNPHWWLCK